MDRILRVLLISCWRIAYTHRSGLTLTCIHLATRKFAKGDLVHLPPEVAAKVDAILIRLRHDDSPASLRENR